MNNSIYHTITRILHTHRQKTSEGPRWILRGHIVAAKLKENSLELYIMFTDDTEISIECKDVNEVITICRMIKSNKILNRSNL